jgi:hypothetical protein
MMVSTDRGRIEEIGSKRMEERRVRRVEAGILTI